MGDPFPRHDRINRTLADLQSIVSQQGPDWRIAFEHMKGVYVVHDQATGARYVGSALVTPESGTAGAHTPRLSTATTLGLKELLNRVDKRTTA